MKFIRDQHDKVAPLFEKGGKLEKFYPAWEAHDTLLFTPGLVTNAASHIRDALDQKRMMITVVVALLPCFLMAMFNTGYQANVAHCRCSSVSRLAQYHLYNTWVFLCGSG